MKKKLIGSLLGGGIIVTAVTIGGLKIKENEDYKKKVIRFKKVAQKFTSSMPSELKDWYLPNWEDDTMWSRVHENKFIASEEERNRERKTFLNEYPTWKSFKDKCYEKAEKSNFLENECHGRSGWCMECGRDPSWDKKK